MRSSFGFVLFVLFVSSALAVACGSDNAGSGNGLPAGPGSSGPVSAEDFPARYADTYCKVASTCCSASSVAYDDAYCRKDNAFDPGKYAALISGKVTRFDPDGASRCLDAMTNAGCAIKDDVDTPGCEGVFVGLVEQGGECSDDIVCAPVAGKRVGCGLIPCEDCKGRCAEFVVSGAGGPCGREVYGECAKGLVCADSTQPTSTCIAAPKLGEKCSLGGPCEEGSGCSSATFVCEARVANGGACKSFAECDENSRCGFDSRVCEPRAADGAPCEIGEDCLSYRCIGGHCRQEVFRSCGGDDDSTGSASPPGVPGPQ